MLLLLLCSEDVSLTFLLEYCLCLEQILLALFRDCALLKRTHSLLDEVLVVITWAFLRRNEAHTHELRMALADECEV